MTEDAEDQRWSSGERNLISDVPGLLVGNAQDRTLKSGVTVLSSAKPFIACVDVMGGAPGTRETDCLAPDKLIEQVDALVLSGGSAFGLDAASGVCDALRSQRRGFAVGPVQVPIVPAAIIFDLLNGGESNWKKNPYADLGREAFDSAGEAFDLGSFGAGTGATTAMLKGGLGSASLLLPNGIVVGALVVVNPHGSPVVPDTRHFWAAPFEMEAEFGGFGLPSSFDPYCLPKNEKLSAYQALHDLPDDAGHLPAGMNTTIAIVATNASLNKSQLKRLAVSAQDGMARAIVPAHTQFDGDLIFTVSVGDDSLSNSVVESMHLGHAAAVCLSRAIARGVYHATAEEGDTLPTWQSIYS